MPYLIVVFMQMLAASIVPLAFKLLKGLGYTAIAYVGINLMLDQAKDYIVQNFQSLPPEWLQLIGLLKIDVAITIILSAYAVRASMWGMNSAGEAKKIRFSGQ